MEQSRLLPALGALLTVTVVSGCGSTPRYEASPDRDTRRGERPREIAKAPAGVPRSRGGGYYLDDGPGDTPPADLDSVPEPVPQLEPLHRGAMRPYVVLGQSFTPMTELAPYKARGVATWYGRRYHGKQTSTGEIYDMYAISAAHPVLPLPSYARVTNVANGRSIVVRVNDRGPFLDGRLIDLSYTAAHRLGILAGGSAVVDVETIIPDGARPAVAAVPLHRSKAAAGAQPPAAVPVDASRVSTPVARNEDAADPIVALAASRESDVAAPPAAIWPMQTAQTPISPTTTPAATPSRIYLQLGAFGSRENAESYLARTRVQLEWLASSLHLFPRDGLFRVHAGPYATTGEARQAAERIAAAFGARPLLVTR